MKEFFKKKEGLSNRGNVRFGDAKDISRICAKKQHFFVKTVILGDFGRQRGLNGVRWSINGGR
jgi:hypothetical protein